MTGKVVYLTDSSVERFGYIRTDMGQHVLLGRNLQGFRKGNMRKLILEEGGIVSFEDHEGIAKNIIVERSPGKITLISRVVAGPLGSIFVLIACAISVLPAGNLLAYLISALLVFCALKVCREAYGKIRDILS